MPEQGLVRGSRVVEGTDDLLGDDKDVRGCLRLDVVEREAEIVFVSDLGGDGLIDDLQEDVIREHVGSPSGARGVTIAVHAKESNECPGSWESTRPATAPTWGRWCRLLSHCIFLMMTPLAGRLSSRSCAAATRKPTAACSTTTRKRSIRAVDSRP